MFLFGKKKPRQTQFQLLKEKWSQRHKEIQQDLWAKHGSVLHDFAQKSQQFALGSVAGLIMLASPLSSSSASTPQTVKEKPFKELDKTATVLLNVNAYLPKQVQPLATTDEQKIGEILSQAYGISVSPQLQGIRLNRSYGYIGAEQHLARFPGDTIETHFSKEEDAISYAGSGMAPGLGAWGYFASSQAALTDMDNLREKYYIAVQTFLSPGYMDHVAAYNSFFKWRKMLVVNPDNGKAIVVVIGDAGPAEWTGKSLGGSPEVMKYLERVDGSAKGAVLYYFIDDPQNKVALGPISL